MARLWLVAFLWVLALLAGGASARGLYVGPGEEYSNIQQAADAASPGDTIIVRDGEYDEDVEILFGGRANITVAADNPPWRGDQGNLVRGC